MEKGRVMSMKPREEGMYRVSTELFDAAEKAYKTRTINTALVSGGLVAQSCC